MKTILAVMALALLCLCSCKWTRKNNPPGTSATNPLIGQWSVDSVDVGRDSSLVGAILLASLIQDTTAADVAFSNDSIFLYSGPGKEREAYRYQNKKGQVMLEDSLRTMYSVRMVNDSMITLTFPDSLKLFLKKK